MSSYSAADLDRVFREVFGPDLADGIADIPMPRRTVERVPLGVVNVAGEILEITALRVTVEEEPGIVFGTDAAPHDSEDV